MFTAFCMEFKKWDNFNYKSNESFLNTYLPIKLDACCNGFQHLVLLSRDNELRKPFNLTESLTSYKPYDFYSYVLENF
jgi:DNA-directed RNA polymerase